MCKVTEDDMKFMVGDFVDHTFFMAKIFSFGVFTRQLQLLIANGNFGDR